MAEKTDEQLDETLETDEPEAGELLDDHDSIIAELEEHQPELLTPAGYAQLSHSGAVVQAVDEQKMSATFTIVTRKGQERNRQGNRVQIGESKFGKGLRTDLGYEAAPVVLYAHGCEGISIPVAVSEDPSGKLTLKKQNTKATATAYFRKLPHSEAVFAAVAEDLLRMASVGFDPMKIMLVKETREDPLMEGVERTGVMAWRGLDFVESELLEWSIVPVGADRGALKQALHRGKIHDVRMPEFLKRSFERAAGPDRVWSPGADFSRQTLTDLGVTVEGAPGDVTSAIERLTAEQDDPEQQIATQQVVVDANQQIPTIPETRASCWPQVAATYRKRKPKRSAAHVARLAQLVEQRVDKRIKPLAKESRQLLVEFDRRSGRVETAECERAGNDDR